MGHWTRIGREYGASWPYWAGAIAGTVGSFLIARDMLTTASGAPIAQPAFVAAVFAVLSRPAWAIGDAVRRFVMPSAFYARDFTGAVRKKMFWLVGPQFIALAIVAFGCFGLSTKLAERAGLRQVPSATPGPAVESIAATARDNASAGTPVMPDAFSGETQDRQLSINKSDNGEYQAIVSNAAGCTGLVDGLSPAFRDGVWVLESSACVLVLQPKPDGFNVAASSNCADLRGRDCPFEGNYSKH